MEDTACQVNIPEHKRDRPMPEFVRGKCPKCGDDLVSNAYWTKNGYLIVWECWSSLKSNPTCDYRDVL